VLASGGKIARTSNSRWNSATIAGLGLARGMTHIGVIKI
jgi:hypothetical protein